MNERSGRDPVGALERCEQGRRLLGALGPVRDHDVLLGYLHAEADALDSPDGEALQAVFERISRRRAHGLRRRLGRPRAGGEACGERYLSTGSSL